MSLDRYQEKRHFDPTPERQNDESDATQAKARLSYVIQKHDASGLHYDFRLELDGVLKSWVVPNGPSTDPAEKRLAVHIEDHPLQYGSFEDIIPKSQYGGSTVMLWDRGWWEPEGDAAEGYANGHLLFTLHGKKLHGDWSLVRLDGKRQRGKQESWLLIKSRNDAASKRGSAPVVTAGVASQGQTDEIARSADRFRKSEADTDATSTSRATHLPRVIKPVLATLTETPPADEEWLHEIKFDGYRIVATVKRESVRLVSRNALDWTAKFPELAKAIGKLAVDSAIIDGEVVALDGQGRSDFSALQDAISRGNTGGLAYIAFDLLYLNGEDLRSLPLEQRKSSLAPLIATGDPARIHYSDHQIGRGGDFFRHACDIGLEGIVSKRRDSPYAGGRSRHWLKTKCDLREDLIVVGYTNPTGTRNHFGALLLGYRSDSGQLIYGGRVGTGFSDAFLAEFHQRLRRIEVKRATVELPENVRPRGIHWVKPEFVAEVQFSERTRDGVLRHPRFLALREDKSAREVILSDDKSPSPPAARAPGSIEIGPVSVTHPDRVLYPDLGITKGDLARYYADIADWIMPFLAYRPLSLLRCPDGVGHECFFQKHLRSGIPASLEQIPITEKHGAETYLAAHTIDGILGLVQMGVMEFHPWGSTTKHLEQPDQLIFDLDPGEGVEWRQIIESAVAVRDLLDALGLHSFAKTSGGKGLHVVAPLTPSLDWEDAKTFSHDVAQYLAREMPDRYTATLSKDARQGRIFIDYLRNGRGATAVAAYSTRARTGATVSMPITWDEVEQGVQANYFTIANTPKRLHGLKRDPWAGFHTIQQTVKDAARRKISPR